MIRHFDYGKHFLLLLSFGFFYIFMCWSLFGVGVHVCEIGILITVVSRNIWIFLGLKNWILKYIHAHTNEFVHNNNTHIFYELIERKVKKSVCLKFFPPHKSIINIIISITVYTKSQNEKCSIVTCDDKWKSFFILNVIHLNRLNGTLKTMN